MLTVDQLKKIGIDAKLTAVQQTILYDVARQADLDLMTWNIGFAQDDPDALYAEQ